MSYNNSSFRYPSIKPGAFQSCDKKSFNCEKNSITFEKQKFCSNLLFLQPTLDIPISIAFGIIFQIFSLCSTSFIEEEHQTWYYLGSTFLLSIFWKNISNTRLKVQTFSSSSSLERDILIFFSILSPLTKPFLAVLLTVFVRRLNQTGDKWMRVPDIGDWFAVADHKIYLSLFFAASKSLLFNFLSFEKKNK